MGLPDLLAKTKRVVSKCSISSKARRESGSMVSSRKVLFPSFAAGRRKTLSAARPETPMMTKTTSSKPRVQSSWHERPRGRAMAPTARANRANPDCSPCIPLGNLPPATGKCLSPRAKQAHSWKRGSAAPADRHFPEYLGISLAWPVVRCLLGVL